jgi:tight adherence protein B
MLVLIAVALIFAAVFFVALSVFGVIMGKKGQLSRRLKELKNIELTHELQMADAMEEQVKENNAPLAAKVIKESTLLDRYYSRIAAKLQKAHVLYRPREFFMLSLGTALFMVLLIFLLSSTNYPSMYRGFGLVISVLFTGAIGFVIPNLYLSFRIGKLKKLLSSQVGDMILMLSNYLRAGHSFIRSIELVSKELSSPLADELKTFNKDMNMGSSLNTALEDLERRTQDQDLGLVLMAIQINYQIGGNLSEILDNINSTIRERIKLKAEINTLTAQGRMTAIIIGLLPVVVGLTISFLQPGFMSALFTDKIGQFMLAMAIVLEIIGIILIRKIVQIEV